MKKYYLKEDVDFEKLKEFGFELNQDIDEEPIYEKSNYGYTYESGESDFSCTNVNFITREIYEDNSWQEHNNNIDLNLIKDLLLANLVEER